MYTMQKTLLCYSLIFATALAAPTSISLDTTSDVAKKPIQKRDDVTISITNNCPYNVNVVGNGIFTTVFAGNGITYSGEGSNNQASFQAGVNSCSAFCQVEYDADDASGTLYFDLSTPNQDTCFSPRQSLQSSDPNGGAITCDEDRSCNRYQSSGDQQTQTAALGSSLEYIIC